MPAVLTHERRHQFTSLVRRAIGLDCGCSDMTQTRRILICLGSCGALLIRLGLALQLPFPPLDDPAFYIQTARNLVSGRGLVIDVIYNYWVPFSSVTHPSHDYWMPLTTLVMAGFMRMLGNTLLAAQAPGILASALLPVVTYLIGRQVWPHQYRWSVLAALNCREPSSAAANSMALYTLLGTAALALAPGDRSPAPAWAVAAGYYAGYAT
jgi:hypothetical protein